MIPKKKRIEKKIFILWVTNREFLRINEYLDEIINYYLDTKAKYYF